MKKIISFAMITLAAITMVVVTGCDKKDDQTALKAPDAPEAPAVPKAPEAPKAPAAPKDHPAH